MFKLFVIKIIKKIFNIKCDGDCTAYMWFTFKNHFYNKDISGKVSRSGPGYESIKECYFCGKQENFFTEW